MRVLSTRRLGLALLGVAAIALSPSAFAQDPLAPADGQEAVADPAPAPADAPDQTPAPAPVDGPAPAEEQPPADAAAPAPAPEQPAEDPAAAAPAPAPEQPAEEPAPAPAPAEDPAPAPEQPVEEPAPAPAPAEEPAAPAPAPAEEPAADPAPAPAPEQPAEEPAPAPAPAPEPPAEEPAAAPPADDQAPPPGDAAAEPPAEESAAAAAPPTDEPAPPEPPPPPATTDAEDPGATPAITPTTGQAGWGWEAQCIGQYLQCGGLNYWGPTNCCEGHQCEFVNDYWWQCNPIPGWVPPAQPAATPAAAPAEPTPAPTRKPHHWGHHHHPTGVPTLAPTFPPTDGGPPFWEQECFRVRKNILNLTPEELADFIEGLQVLKANGVYDNITAIHGDPKTFGLFHGNDYFLPWHRWYVLKIESAVRALGGKWACFAMPYWDWTLDAGREMESPIWNIFGPMGKKNDSFCMREGPWAEWKNNKGTYRRVTSSVSCISVAVLLRASFSPTPPQRQITHTYRRLPQAHRLRLVSLLLPRRGDGPDPQQGQARQRLPPRLRGRRALPPAPLHRRRHELLREPRRPHLLAAPRHGRQGLGHVAGLPRALRPAQHRARDVQARGDRRRARLRPRRHHTVRARACMYV